MDLAAALLPVLGVGDGTVEGEDAVPELPGVGVPEVGVGVPEAGDAEIRSAEVSSILEAVPLSREKANGTENATPQRRLNPIKRKQLEEQLQGLEAEIGSLEAAIAACEASLQSYVSAEETARLSHELTTRRASLQARLAQWEELTQALQS